MKKDNWSGLLVVVFVATTLGAAASCYQFLQVSRDARRLAELTTQVNQGRAALASMSADLAEYSRRNTNIEPLLIRINQLAAAQNNSPAK